MIRKTPSGYAHMSDAERAQLTGWQLPMPTHPKHDLAPHQFPRIDMPAHHLVVFDPKA